MENKQIGEEGFMYTLHIKTKDQTTKPIAMSNSIENLVEYSYNPDLQSVMIECWIVNNQTGAISISSV